jgi:uncharacterized protein (TIGR04255 family)
MFNLEEPRRYRLARAPLAQALVQVRFPVVAHLQLVSGIAPVQDRLASTFPYMEQQQVQQLGLMLGPAGLAGAEGQANVQWQFSDDDGRLFTLSPNSASFSVGTQYVGIDDFAARFETILAALAEVEQLRRCDRLGVRYLSVAGETAAGRANWRSWFRPEVVTWVGTDVLSSGSLVSSLTQTDLLATNTDPMFTGVGPVRGLIRSGVVPADAVIQGLPPVKASSTSFIIDLDLFVESPQKFNTKQIHGQFLSLHSEIDRFFLWTLSEEGRKHFGFKEIG